MESINSKGEFKMCANEQVFLDLINKSEEEIADMIDSGMMNSFIEAYAVIAMQDAGFKVKDIKKLDFSYIFDFYGAKEAKNKANKIMQERNCKER